MRIGRMLKVEVLVNNITMLGISALAVIGLAVVAIYIGKVVAIIYIKILEWVRG